MMMTCDLATYLHMFVSAARLYQMTSKEMKDRRTVRTFTYNYQITLNIFRLFQNYKHTKNNST